MSRLLFGAIVLYLVVGLGRGRYELEDHCADANAVAFLWFLLFWPIDLLLESAIGLLLLWNDALLPLRRRR